MLNCNLTASFAIQLHVDPMVHVARLGENVTFKCEVTGDSPFIVYTVWYDKANSLLNSSNLTEDSHILILLVTVMSYEDYQEYTCVVSNDNTNVTVTAVLSK